MRWYEAMPEYDRQYTSAPRDSDFYLFAMYVSRVPDRYVRAKREREEKNSKIEIQKLIFLKHAHHFPFLSIYNY